MFEGFTMTFKNGLTISVQFGIGNYSSRDRNDVAESAEIAIWDENQNWYDFGGDRVKGWCSPDEVADWINKVRCARSINIDEKRGEMGFDALREYINSKQYNQ